MIACNACQLLATNLPVCHSSALELPWGRFISMLICVIFNMVRFYLYEHAIARILCKLHINRRVSTLHVWLNLVFVGVIIDHLPLLRGRWSMMTSTNPRLKIERCWDVVFFLIFKFFKKKHRRDLTWLQVQSREFEPKILDLEVLFVLCFTIQVALNL